MSLASGYSSASTFSPLISDVPIIGSMARDAIQNDEFTAVASVTPVDYVKDKSYEVRGAMKNSTFSEACILRVVRESDCVGVADSSMKHRISW